MSATLHRLPRANSPQLTGGVVWHRLHSEREEICELLLSEPAPGPDTSTAEPGLRNDSRYRDLLQARLKKVDEALDRLMAGSYGNCTKCDKWIEDTKLELDPTIALCLECWNRLQTKHQDLPSNLIATEVVGKAGSYHRRMS